MGIEENKAKALRIFQDLFNRGDDSWVDTELFDPPGSSFTRRRYASADPEVPRM